MHDTQRLVRAWIRMHIWIGLIRKDELPIRTMLWSLAEGRYEDADERNPTGAGG